MDQKAGAQISQRAFIQSLVILFLLMMIAGVLTLVVPAGGIAFHPTIRWHLAGYN